ncbi:MAG TPA: DUF4136 domain-containing protein [Verrucomicrobiales bacterium]|nr:DUF4136 domain-containing protein [Verrucomicrobiales bacterium]
MKYLRLLLFALGLVFSAAGCSSTSREFPSSGDYFPAAAIPGASTYDWILDPGQDDMINPFGNSPATHDAIRRAVEGEMSRKGYMRRAASPAYRIGYLVVLKEGTTTAIVNRYFGYDRSADTAAAMAAVSPEMMSRTHDTGSLVIDVMDATTRRLVLYRGTVGTELDRSRTPQERELMIREAAHEALRRLPAVGAGR